VIDKSSLIEFIILQISVAFSPGLIIALVVNESVQKSRKNGIQVAIGAAGGALILTFVSALIFTFIFNLIPNFLNFIYFFGIIYIFYKGYKTLNSEATNTRISKVVSSSLMSGFKVNLINPKMWVFYLSVLPLFLLKTSNVFTSLLLLGLLTLFINLCADITYAFLSSYFFRSSSEARKKLINKISGFSLILIGFYLLFTRIF